MTSVLIVTDVDGFAFASRAQALQRHAPPGMNVEILPYADRDIASIPLPQYDVIFCLPPNQLRGMRSHLDSIDSRIPLIGSWNSGVGRIGYDLAEVHDLADFWVVNNYLAWADAMRRIKPFRGCHISNGVDTSVFRSIVPIAERRPKVLWIASEHKANDDYDVKGFAEILSPLLPILDAKGIEHEVRVIPHGEEMSQEEMCVWYNSGSVFLVTSRSEGTPNTALEAAACGCVVVGFPVGNLPELIRHKQNGYIVERRGQWPLAFVLEGINDGLANREKYSAAMSEAIREWNWKTRAAFFYGLFEDAANGLLANQKPWTFLNSVHVGN